MLFIQAGFTFLEILIALCLFSISFLGFVSLNLFGSQSHYAAYQESIAASQVMSMIQRLKANPFKLSEELALWNIQNREVLPNGDGIANFNKNLCEVLLKWHYHEKHFILKSKC